MVMFEHPWKHVHFVQREYWQYWQDVDYLACAKMRPVWTSGGSHSPDKWWDNQQGTCQEHRMMTMAVFLSWHGCDTIQIWLATNYSAQTTQNRDTHKQTYTRKQVIHYSAIMHRLTRVWSPRTYGVGGPIVLRSHDVMKNIVFWLGRFSVNHFRCLFVAVDWSKLNVPHVSSVVDGAENDLYDWVFLILGLVLNWLTDSCHHVSEVQELCS